MRVVNQKRLRRQSRIRFSIRRYSSRPRLSVFRSPNHIYAQVIDDKRFHTVASISTMDSALRKKLKNGGNIEAARQVGRLIAEHAVKAGVTDVVFDRGRYAYHGRLKALAEAAREAGLNF